MACLLSCEQVREASEEESLDTLRLVENSIVTGFQVQLENT